MTVISDRVFWIYLIVALFFVIIGLSLIFNSGDPYSLVISILWLLSVIALLIIVYEQSHADTKCILDNNCLSGSSQIWIYINILFLLLLILGTVWASELGGTESGGTSSSSGILILLGGLLLTGLVRQKQYSVPFWVAVFYVLIWFILTFYAAITTT